MLVITLLIYTLFIIYILHKMKMMDFLWTYIANLPKLTIMLTLTFLFKHYLVIVLYFTPFFYIPIPEWTNKLFQSEFGNFPDGYRTFLDEFETLNMLFFGSWFLSFLAETVYIYLVHTNKYGVAKVLEMASILLTNISIILILFLYLCINTRTDQHTKEMPRYYLKLSLLWLSFTLFYSSIFDISGWICTKLRKEAQRLKTGEAAGSLKEEQISHIDD